MDAFSLPTQGPADYGSRALRNPILDEIDAAATNAHAQLSPQAQEALKRAGAPVPQQQTQPQPLTPPKAAPAPIAPVPQSPEEQANVAELNRITGPGPQSGSGISQMKHAGARVPLQILDAIGSGLFPRIAAGIPGTQAHHDVLVAQREGAVKQGEELRKGEEAAQLNAAQQQQQLASAQNLQSEADVLHPAQAEHAQAQAWALLNPQDKERELTEFALWHQQNPDSPVSDWLKLKAGEAKEPGNAFALWHQQNPQGTAEDWLTLEQQNKPETKSEYEDFKAGYLKSHPQATTEEVVRAYAAAHRSPEENTGTWSAAYEDENGRPMQMNNKTGAVRPAPAGVQTRGTFAKEQPAKDALSYAEQYVGSGKFTAAGDEALMDQFFQLAKPKRMNAQQNQILMEGRDMIQGATAKAKHLFTPNAPYFDDTQRQNIVQTMRDLSKSQGHGGEEPAGDIPKVGETFQGGKVKKVTKIE